MSFVSHKLNGEYFKNKIEVECYKDVKGVYKSSTLGIDIRGLIYQKLWVTLIRVGTRNHIGCEMLKCKMSQENVRRAT